jgi:hypothetical protein
MSVCRSHWAIERPLYKKYAAFTTDTGQGWRGFAADPRRWRSAGGSDVSKLVARRPFEPRASTWACASVGFLQSSSRSAPSYHASGTLVLGLRLPTLDLHAPRLAQADAVDRARTERCRSAQRERRLAATRGRLSQYDARSTRLGSDEAKCTADRSLVDRSKRRERSSPSGVLAAQPPSASGARMCGCSTRYGGPMLHKRG